jgi:hypothetical protein
MHQCYQKLKHDHMGVQRGLSHHRTLKNNNSSDTTRITFFICRVSRFTFRLRGSLNFPKGLGLHIELGGSKVDADKVSVLQYSNQTLAMVPS